MSYDEFSLIMTLDLLNDVAPLFLWNQKTIVHDQIVVMVALWYNRWRVNFSGTLTEYIVVEQTGYRG